MKAKSISKSTGAGARYVVKQPGTVPVEQDNAMNERESIKASYNLTDEELEGIIDIVNTMAAAGLTNDPAAAMLHLLGFINTQSVDKFSLDVTAVGVGDAL